MSLLLEDNPCQSIPKLVNTGVGQASRLSKEISNISNSRDKNARPSTRKNLKFNEELKRNNKFIAVAFIIQCPRGTFN